MRHWLCLALILLLACDDAASPAVRPRRDSARSADTRSQDQGGVDVVDASTPRSGEQAGSKAPDAGQRQRSDSARAAGGKGGKAGNGGNGEMTMAMAPQRVRDSGVPEAAAGGDKAPDAGDAEPNAPDAASMQSAADAGTEPASEVTQNTGSCCSTSSAPGCGDPALRACVCELESRCCSEAWDETCTRIVREKRCQRGVRDCVCGSGEAQWQQTYCCQGGWNDTCESVAYNKCGATADCP